jgi:hypothetical protein
MHDRDYIDGRLEVYELNDVSLLPEAHIDAYLAENPASALQPSG